MPWSFTVSYGITMSEDRSKPINVHSMRYPYSFTQTMNFSRDLHCFDMSCNVVLRPYSSFNFTFRARASELADALKWDKRSSYSSNVEWY